MPTHVPVMSDEVIEWLAPGRGGVFVDCTIGLGGHAAALLDAGADRVVGLDRDEEALASAREALATWAGRVDLVHADFRQLEAVLDERGIELVDGALADLGLSSFQIEHGDRGFSFQRDEPLDMRMDRSGGPTVAELLSSASELELADVIFAYGEERYSRRIARAIARAQELGPIERTGQLAGIVRRAVPRKGFQRIDPATRTFQALRIWVNRELEGLDAFLSAAAGRLRAEGRLAVITFHSLEDRIVKHTFRHLGQPGSGTCRVLTRKPILPSEAEVERNPRARSAKLRVVERIGAVA